MSVLIILLLTLSLPFTDSFGISTGLTMSTIPPENASAAARRNPDSNQFVMHKMCPYAQKAWIALEHSRIPFKLTEIPLYGPNGKPSWFLDMNPGGTVPVLSCYGGAVILPDSESILEYIVQAKLTGPEGNPLALEQNTAVYESAEEWRQFVLNDVIPVGKSAVLGDKACKKQLFALLKSKADKIQGPFLCGSEVTVADCAAFPFLWRIREEFGLDECEAWAKWLKECERLPAFEKTVQSSWWWWW